MLSGRSRRIMEAAAKLVQTLSPSQATDLNRLPRSTVKQISPLRPKEISSVFHPFKQEWEVLEGSNKCRKKKKKKNVDVNNNGNKEASPAQIQDNSPTDVAAMTPLSRPISPEISPLVNLFPQATEEEHLSGEKKKNKRKAVVKRKLNFESNGGSTAQDIVQQLILPTDVGQLSPLRPSVEEMSPQSSQSIPGDSDEDPEYLPVEDESFFAATKKKHRFAGISAKKRQRNVLVNPDSPSNLSDESDSEVNESDSKVNESGSEIEISDTGHIFIVPSIQTDVKLSRMLFC